MSTAPAGARRDRSVDDYQPARGITDELVTVDWTGVHRRKTTDTTR